MTPKGFLSFLMPGGLIWAAAAVLLLTDATASWLPRIVQIYPWAVFSAGILLGWRFDRSRLVFAVLALAIADRSLLYFAPGGTVSLSSAKLVHNAVAILLPLNLALFSFMKERGTTSASGFRRFCFIFAQPIVVAAACYFNGPVINSYVEYPIINASFLQYVPELTFPQAIVIASFVAFLLLCFSYARKRGPIESGFIWAFFTVGFALAAYGPKSSSTFYFSTAGLILVVAVIEASYAMAFRDELTGLPARRSLNEFLLKVGSKYTLAMLDIDHFKKFNDKYGHDVGDQVLRMVAAKIDGIDGGGKAFRYGGEEFTIIFPGKSRNEAVPHLEELRALIQSSGFTIRSSGRPRKKPDEPSSSKGPRKKVGITISIGVAEKNGRHADAQDVIKAADRALYRAKKAGRNRVAV